MVYQIRSVWTIAITLEFYTVFLVIYCDIVLPNHPQTRKEFKYILHKIVFSNYTYWLFGYKKRERLNIKNVSNLT